MGDDCIIQADFASFRHVQGRKILQLIMEVPQEEGEAALRMLGMPRSGESKWCAIALLDTENPVAQRVVEATYNADAKPVVERLADAGSSPAGNPTKKWAEYARSQQAHLLTKDPAFWQYFGAANAVNCDGKLKLHFRIASKSELDAQKHHEGWDEFVALFYLHRDRLK